MKIFVTAIMAATALVSLPVQAQDDQQRENNNSMQTGTRFQRAAETPDAGRGRMMQKRVANCMFNRHKDEVRTVLANSNFYSVDFDAIGVEQDDWFDDLEMDYCIGRLMRGADNRTYHTYMQVQYSTMRNLLAEEAYLQDFDGPPVIPAGSAIDVAGRFDGQRMHPQIATMARMADCLTYNAPQQAHDLLQSRPGSGDEEEVVEALGPVVVACANTDETELSIPTSLIRQMAADGLWSRSHYGSSTEAEVGQLSGTPSASAGVSRTEEQFARCAVEKDPAAARALLDVESQQQFQSAMEALVVLCPFNGRIDSGVLNEAITDLLPGDAA